MAASTNPWALYDELIAGIPEGIEVLDFCLGQHWAYVEATCGMGVAHALHDGARGGFGGDPLQRDLKGLASLVKSWSFRDATLGTAAINAWYSQPQRIEALGGFIDRGGAPADAPRRGDAANPFHTLVEQFRGKKVAVIGHFPNVEDMAATCDLTVLERVCTSDLDTPDPACEYVLPEQDLVLMTGTTLTNKTAPRLLQLSAGVVSAMVGPSSVPAPALFERGLTMVDGSVVVDPASAKLAVKGGSKLQWRTGIKKFSLAAL